MRAVPTTVMNHPLAQRPIDPQPTLEDAQVGDWVTRTTYTDRTAGVIVSRTAKTIVMQDAKAQLLNGPSSGQPDAMSFSPGGFVGHTSGAQRWDLEPDPDGETHKFTLRSTGQWKRAGTRSRERGNYLRAGASPHYDYNF